MRICYDQGCNDIGIELSYDKEKLKYKRKLTYQNEPPLCPLF